MVRMTVSGCLDLSVLVLGDNELTGISSSRMILFMMRKLLTQISARVLFWQDILTQTLDKERF